MATAPVFVHDGLTGRGPGPLTLAGPEGRHAVSVRRLRVGEAVVLTDGEGTGASGTVAAVDGRDRLTIDVTEVSREESPRPWLTVVQALAKGDRGELAVAAMTETGVDAIVPWSAARCVTQWHGERGARSLEKWRATAREAGKQARRVWFPRVPGPMTTRQVAEGPVAEATFVAVLHESADQPLATAPLPEQGDIVLIVGPEGGVTPEELDAFAAAGARAYRLGPTVLRTSTAGTAAAALLMGRTGRWA
ncbi:16S rRNA (uracil(1498)-N(3))-methyltransferase [Streptomyces sp. MP131-18]|uniref:16S rRNA (uracil(1498)-N(3))-methyltransferase n=1 Tax=Streptomyces sp. MP131-18 TaxID=1857892 RepID=UPI00097C4616|nr:16S rRNA (uracil(1498)-N(3))-methyltransferase [Streptomyces sp. MP131-18]ONK14433.1 Ribosomal RNA small subunit methyltransferase E [Streptomyces sp. MP131-18]